MAIKHMNYLALSRKARVTSGAGALSDLRRMLNVPGIPPEQRSEIQARIDQVTRWIEGSLPTMPKVEMKAPAGFRTTTVTGKHHTVVVSEKIAVDEKIS